MGIGGRYVYTTGMFGSSFYIAYIARKFSVFSEVEPDKKTAFLPYSVPFRTPKRESEGPIPQKHNDAAIASIVYQAGKVLINYFSIKNKAKL